MGISIKILCGVHLVGLMVVNNESLKFPCYQYSFSFDYDACRFFRKTIYASKHRSTTPLFGEFDKVQLEVVVCNLHEYLSFNACLLSPCPKIQADGGAKLLSEMRVATHYLVLQVELSSNKEESSEIVLFLILLFNHKYVLAFVYFSTTTHYPEEGKSKKFGRSSHSSHQV